MTRIERQGLTKYALRVTAGADEHARWTFRFTITSADGTKQHANATLSPTDAADVALFIRQNRTTGRNQ